MFRITYLTHDKVLTTVLVSATTVKGAIDIAMDKDETWTRLISCRYCATGEVYKLGKGAIASP